MKRMEKGSDGTPYEEISDSVEELSGQLGGGDQLPRSVTEGENSEGKVLEEAINRGLNSFVPDMMFSSIVQNYKQAKQLYGERILREISGYDPEYLEQNSGVPEFKRELQSAIGQKIKSMKEQGLLEADGSITEKGLEYASLVLYTEELDRMEAKGLLGEREHTERSHYGTHEDSAPYKQGDRYHDIDVNKTIKVAIRRGHRKLIPEDLRIYEREAKGKIEIIYAIDASGSMKGKKLAMSKKAGVALAYKAIENKDAVGVVIFGSNVKTHVRPTTDFWSIVQHIAKASASKETDFVQAIETSSELFSEDAGTKLLVFITDGMPTKGETPEDDALNAIAQASAQGITISMIGIDLQEKSADFLREAVLRGNGKFQAVRDVEELDVVVLEEYDSVV